MEEAILALGLGRCRNTPIRPGGSISGGERKRVCVASEMLTNPSLIFLDEPTSGLDSTAASVLVKILQDLAKIGRTVVCTIHQPNASIFSTFDSLMLLSKGESMYYGRRRCVTDWFSGVGVPCPYGVNISEHFIDVASCTATVRASNLIQTRLCLPLRTPSPFHLLIH